MQYQIRIARNDDLATLNHIHRENMKGYVEKVYPWNESLFCQNFLPQEYQVLEAQQQLIGFIKIVASNPSIYLAEIQIASQYQNKGIGTTLIKSVVQEAIANNQRIWLKVLKGNPAEKLYQRLGFTTFEESKTHKKMEIKATYSKNSA